MTPEEKRQIIELENRINKLENVLFGFSNDVRLQSKIRGSIIVGEHTANKPTIVAANGKKYNLQTV